MNEIVAQVEAQSKLEKAEVSGTAVALPHRAGQCSPGCGVWSWCAWDVPSIPSILREGAVGTPRCALCRSGMQGAARARERLSPSRLISQQVYCPCLCCRGEGAGKDRAAASGSISRVGQGCGGHGRALGPGATGHWSLPLAGRPLGCSVPRCLSREEHQPARDPSQHQHRRHQHQSAQPIAVHVRAPQQGDPRGLCGAHSGSGRCWGAQADWQRAGSGDGAL